MGDQYPSPSAEDFHSHTFYFQYMCDYLDPASTKNLQQTRARQKLEASYKSTLGLQLAPSHQGIYLKKKKNWAEDQTDWHV